MFMHEILHRNYRREEEFVERFRSSAWKASVSLNGEWKPNSNCDDTERQQRKYCLLMGHQSRLIFKSAAVYHDPDSGAFTSALILLESSTRAVEVTIRKENDGLTAEISIDRPLEPRRVMAR
jgi:hypothetical protein